MPPLKVAMPTAARAPRPDFAEDLDHEIGKAVDHLGLLGEVGRGIDHAQRLDDAGHAIERDR